TTEALNLVAWTWGRANVKEGDEIVITGMEHHANFVPWQQLALQSKAKLKIARIAEDGSIDLNDLRSMLSKRTKVVAFGHVSNALGTINPVKEIAAMAHAAAAIVVVDGAQAAPHLPLNIDSTGADFYAF